MWQYQQALISHMGQNVLIVIYPMALTEIVNSRVHCAQKSQHIVFLQKNICNTWLSWKAKRVKAGTWIEQKSANNATSTTALSAPLQPDVQKELDTLKQ